MAGTIEYEEVPNTEVSNGALAKGMEFNWAPKKNLEEVFWGVLKRTEDRNGQGPFTVSKICSNNRHTLIYFKNKTGRDVITFPALVCLVEK